MLAYNDKWRRIHFGQKQPEKGEYGYSGESESWCFCKGDNHQLKFRTECLYCNGTYDKAVQEKLNRKPSPVQNVHGPWTEGLVATA
jgi:hypothetical protein